MSKDVKNIMLDISKENGYNILQMETDIDHIHILLEYRPKDSVSDVVKALKQYSTYRMWLKYHDTLKKFYWKRNILWSEGYYACSIGQVSQETIEYITLRIRVS